MEFNDTAADDRSVFLKNYQVIIDIDNVMILLLLSNCFVEHY